MPGQTFEPGVVDDPVFAPTIENSVDNLVYARPKRGTGSAPRYEADPDLAQYGEEPKLEVSAFSDAYYDIVAHRQRKADAHAALIAGARQGYVPGQVRAMMTQQVRGLDDQRKRDDAAPFGVPTPSPTPPPLPLDAARSEGMSREPSLSLPHAGPESMPTRAITAPGMTPVASPGTDATASQPRIFDLGPSNYTVRMEPPTFSSFGGFPGRKLFDFNSRLPDAIAAPTSAVETTAPKGEAGGKTVTPDAREELIKQMNGLHVPYRPDTARLEKAEREYRALMAPHVPEIRDPRMSDAEAVGVLAMMLANPRFAAQTAAAAYGGVGNRAQIANAQSVRDYGLQYQKFRDDEARLGGEMEAARRELNDDVQTEYGRRNLAMRAYERQFETFGPPPDDAPVKPRTEDGPEGDSGGGPPRRGLNPALKAWGARLRAFQQAGGVPTIERQGELDRERHKIAAEYGIDVNRLPKARVGTTTGQYAADMAKAYRSNLIPKGANPRTGQLVGSVDPDSEREAQGWDRFAQGSFRLDAPQAGKREGDPRVKGARAALRAAQTAVDALVAEAGDLADALEDPRLDAKTGAAIHSRIGQIDGELSRHAAAAGRAGAAIAAIEAEKMGSAPVPKARSKAGVGPGAAGVRPTTGSGASERTRVAAIPGVTMLRPEGRGDRVNPRLASELGGIAAMGYRLGVSTASTGHDLYVKNSDGTRSRNTSMHGSGGAVDVTSINGHSLRTKEGRRLAYELQDRLVAQGYAKNRDGGGASGGVIWGVVLKRGGDHRTHMHISYPDLPVGGASALVPTAPVQARPPRGNPAGRGATRGPVRQTSPAVPPKTPVKKTVTRSGNRFS